MFHFFKTSKITILLFLVLIISSVFINQLIWAQLKNQALEERNSLQAKINNQKIAKNTIREQWQKQAEYNDRMIKAGDTVKTKTDILSNQIKKSIRFVFDKPEILPSIDQKSLETAQKELDEAQKSLEIINQEAIQFKIESTNKVDALYLQLQEDQFNRANPDGIKQ
jgi:hypothetical protein